MKLLDKHIQAYSIIYLLSIGCFFMLSIENKEVVQAFYRGSLHMLYFLPVIGIMKKKPYINAKFWRVIFYLQIVSSLVFIIMALSSLSTLIVAEDTNTRIKGFGLAIGLPIFYYTYKYSKASQSWWKYLKK
jgi:hypothetical protein